MSTKNPAEALRESQVRWDSLDKRIRAGTITRKDAQDVVEHFLHLDALDGVTHPLISAVRDVHLSIRGKFRAELYGPDGRLKQVETKSNLIVTAGKDWLKELALDSVTPSTEAYMTHIAVGSNSTAPAAGDTDLNTVISPRRAFDASTGYTAGGTGVATVTRTFAAGENTGTIVEAGVFDAVTTGTMFNRVTFGAIVKAAGDSLKVAFTFTFA